MVASADVSNLAAKRPGRELTSRGPEVAFWEVRLGAHPFSSTWTRRRQDLSSDCFCQEAARATLL